MLEIHFEDHHGMEKVVAKPAGMSDGEFEDLFRGLSVIAGKPRTHERYRFVYDGKVVVDQDFRGEHVFEVRLFRDGRDVSDGALGA